MARRWGQPSAIAIPCLGNAELADRDGTSTGSVYTEVGPRPGASIPVDDGTRAVPVISGEQGPDLELVVLRAGQPLLSDAGCQIGYREAGEADSLVRGWSPPNWLSGWSTPAWSTTEEYTNAPSAILTVPSTQEVVVVYAWGDVYSTTWSPVTGWSEPVGIDIVDGNGSAGAVHGDRLLWINPTKVMRSDDRGASWELHAYWPAGLSVAMPVDVATAACDALGRVLYVGLDGTDLVQAASQDGACSWEEVDTGAAPGAGFRAVALPGGGFVVAYLTTTDFHVAVRVLASATDSLLDADEVVVSATEAGSVAICADPDGILWLHATDDGTYSQVRLWASLDGGLTWTATGEGAWRGESATDQLVLKGSASASGTVHLLHGWSGTGGSYPDSLGVLRLGGWSSLPAARPAWGADDSTSWLDRSGTGVCGSAYPTHTAVYLPIEVPNATGWTATGAGSAVLGTQGRLQITTTAGQNRWYSLEVPASYDSILVQASVARVVDGGDEATNAIALRARAGRDSGAVWGSDVAIRLVDTGTLVVWDEVDGVELARVEDLDLSLPVRLLLQIDNGYPDSLVAPRALAAYRTTSESAWTVLYDGACGDNGSRVAADAIAWGHIATGEGESRWQWVMVSTEARVDYALPIGDAPAGRPLSAVPVPLDHGTGPGGVDDGPAWISCVSGPAVLGEEWQVPAEHDYPIEALDPTLSPSPEAGWRSDADAEVLLVWDQDGRREWIGDCIAVLFHRVNFRIAALEYYDSDTSTWTEVAGLDLATGFTVADGLTYRLTGRTLRPGASSAAGARYIQEGELAGGHVLIDGDARTIAWNTAGVWAGDSVSAPKVRIELEGITGTETAEDTCALVWPSGVLLYHLEAFAAYRRWRVRIPASTETPDGDYRAGLISPMTVRALGAPTDWGWSRERTPSAETTRTRSGTTRTVRRGRAPRSYTAGWTGGVQQLDLRAVDAGSPSIDYVAAGDDLPPLTAAEDVAWLLDGLLEATDSGAIPVLWLPRLPEGYPTTPGSVAYSTLTDPTLWLYARLTSSIRADHEVGDELAAVERVGTLTFEEIV